MNKHVTNARTANKGHNSILKRIHMNSKSKRALSVGLEMLLRAVLLKNQNAVAV
jgi:hypothetical protein